MRPEQQTDGTWRVTVDPAWPGFAGHFPGDPIVPAAMLVDWGLLALGRPAMLKKARFTSPLRPGETAVLTRNGSKIEIACGDRSVAVLQFTAP